MRRRRPAQSAEAKGPADPSRHDVPHRCSTGRGCSTRSAWWQIAVNGITIALLGRCSSPTVLASISSQRRKEGRGEHRCLSKARPTWHSQIRKVPSLEDFLLSRVLLSQEEGLMNCWRCRFLPRSNFRSRGASRNLPEAGESRHSLRISRSPPGPALPRPWLRCTRKGSQSHT